MDHCSTAPSHCHSSSSKSSWVSVGSAFALAIFSMLAGMPALVGFEPSLLTAGFSGGFALVSLALFGRTYMYDIYKLFHAATMNTLVGLGILASFGLSIYQIFWMNSYELYFESAAFIIAFVKLGQTLEARVQNKMDEYMKTLTSFLPKKTRRLESGSEVEVSIDQIKEGDLISLRVGERVPVDCVIQSQGNYLFDVSIVTGESQEVSRKEGEPVPQGALLAGQPVQLMATHVSSSSLYEQLAKEVKKTLSKKPKIQQTVDRITRLFVPAVVLLSGSAALFWKMKFPQENYFILTSVSVLVIACPCALGMATPTAIFVGALRAAKNGFLIKSLDAIEKGSEITTIAFDKTGTLTEGRPEVVGFKAGDNLAHKEILKIAATIEKNSEHPYAEAVRNKAKADGISLYSVVNSEIVAGKGVRATLDMNGKTQKAHIGSLYFLLEEGYESTEVPQDLRWEAEGSGNTALWLGLENKFMGIIFLGDKIRKDAILLTEKLVEQKYDVGMITGDTEEVAHQVQKSLGLKFVHAGVLPKEKAALIRKLTEPRKKGLDMFHPKVAFVGDGINDAPALAEAHLGVAMGSGASLSQSAADVILVNGEIGAVSRVFEILKSTRRLIRENLFLSFGYNVIAIPIAAGALIPLYQISLTPKVAALAMALSSLSVLLNSSRRLI